MKSWLVQLINVESKLGKTGLMLLVDRYGFSVKSWDLVMFFIRAFCYEVAHHIIYSETKYNKSIMSTIFHFKKLISDLDIDANSPNSWDCKESKCFYPAAGHVITGNLKIISDSRIRSIICGPKYRFPSRIDLKKCREEIAAALNDFGNRWCKREYVKPSALKRWKLRIFQIIDQRIEFYSQNTNLLPSKPKSSFRHLQQGIQKFHRMFVLVLADKAANNVVVSCCLTTSLY